jgi:hypothetical protein
MVMVRPMAQRSHRAREQAQEMARLRFLEANLHVFEYRKVTHEISPYLSTFQFLAIGLQANHWREEMQPQELRRLVTSRKERPAGQWAASTSRTDLVWVGPAEYSLSI